MRDAGHGVPVQHGIQLLRPSRGRERTVADLRRAGGAPVPARLQAGRRRLDDPEDVERDGATPPVRQRVRGVRPALPDPRRRVAVDDNRLRVRPVHEAATRRRPDLQQPVPHEQHDHVQPRRATDL